MLSPEDLEIEGSELKLRFTPLSTGDAIDEFMSFGDSFEASGALTLLIEAGSGVRFDPSAWDVSDAALVFKTLMRALRADEDKPQKASDIFKGICTRYGVEIYRHESWVKVGEDIDALGTDLPFVAYKCLGSSIIPFINRLKSLAAAKVAKQARLSSESTKAS